MITTTTGKAIAALNALGELRGQKINRDTAKALFHLKKQLNDSSEFYVEQICEVCDRLGVAMINGVVQFGDAADKREAFIREVADIEAVEAKLDCEPVDLSGEEIKISAEFVEATDGFIKI